MKTPFMLLQDLESLHTLQKEGGISLDEFKNSKKETIDLIINDNNLGTRHLKLAHDLLAKTVIMQEDYDKIKKAALKIKVPTKPTLKSNETTFSLAQVLLYLYKLLLFGISFVVKLFLGIINFFIINLAIDNLKNKK